MCVGEREGERERLNGSHKADKMRGKGRRIGELSRSTFHKFFQIVEQVILEPNYFVPPRREINSADVIIN